MNDQGMKLLSEMRREISNLKRAAEDQTFEEANKGRKFPNPETENQVEFKSLPGYEQKRLRAEFAKSQKKEESSEKKDKPDWRKGKPLEGKAKKQFDSIDAVDERDLADFAGDLSSLIEKMDNAEDLVKLVESDEIMKMDMSEIKEVFKEVLSRDSEGASDLVGHTLDRVQDHKYNRLVSSIEDLDDKYTDEVRKVTKSLASHIDFNAIEEDDEISKYDYNTAMALVNIRSIGDLVHLSEDSLMLLGKDKLQSVLDLEERSAKKRRAEVDKVRSSIDKDYLKDLNFSYHYDSEDLDLSQIKSALESLKAEEGKKKKEETLKKNRSRSIDERKKDISSAVSKAVESLKSPPKSRGELATQIGRVGQQILEGLGIDRNGLSDLEDSELDVLIESFNSLNKGMKETYGKTQAKKKKEHEAEVKEIEKSRPTIEKKIESWEKKTSVLLHRVDGILNGGKQPSKSLSDKLHAELKQLDSARKELTDLEAKIESYTLPPETDDLVASYGGQASDVLATALKERAKRTKKKEEEKEAKRVEDLRKEQEAKVKEYEKKITGISNKAKGAKSKSDLKPLYTEIGAIKGQLSNSEMMGVLMKSIQGVEDTLKNKSDELSLSNKVLSLLGLGKKAHNLKTARLAVEILRQEIEELKREHK